MYRFYIFFILKKTQLQQQTNKEQNKYNKKKYTEMWRTSRFQ